MHSRHLRKSNPLSRRGRANKPPVRTPHYFGEFTPVYRSNWILFQAQKVSWKLCLTEEDDYQTDRFFSMVRKHKAYSLSEQQQAVHNTLLRDDGLAFAAAGLITLAGLEPDVGNIYARVNLMSPEEIRQLLQELLTPLRPIAEVRWWLEQRHVYIPAAKHARLVLAA